MNHKQAVETLKMKKTEMDNKFCPIIKGHCRQDCVSYVPGVVRGLGCVDARFGQDGPERQYYISGPYCNSPLINGDVYSPNSVDFVV